MITEEEITNQFKAELQSLLDKYGAELEAEDHYPGYAECGEDVRMTAYIPTQYDESYNMVRESANINLGQRMYGKKNSIANS